MIWFRNLTIRKKELITGFSILIIVIGSFTSAEVILRVKQISKFGTLSTVEKMDTFYIEPETGLRIPKPNATMGKIKFNSSGFRGPELAETKSKDTIRIAYLGSSITFDPFISDDNKTWAGATTEKLSLLYPQCKFEYLNAGIPGLGTVRLQDHYEKIVSKMKPDLVFIMTDDRNSRLDEIAINKRIHDGVHYSPSWLAQNSLFWGKLEKNAVIQKRIRSLTLGSDMAFSADELLKKYRPKIRSLIKAINNDNAIPILLSFGQKIRKNQSKAEQVSAISSSLFYMPYMTVADFLRTAEMYNNENIRASQQTDTIYISWHENVLGADQNFIDSRHFTVIGSEHVAKSIAEQTVSSKIFNQTLKEKGFTCIEGL